jgi:hypothetical protein
MTAKEHSMLIKFKGDFDTGGMKHRKRSILLFFSKINTNTIEFYSQLRLSDVRPNIMVLV